MNRGRAPTVSDRLASLKNAKAKTRRAYRALASLGLFVVFVAAWELTVRLLKIPDLLVPAPSSVAQALWAGLAVSPSSPLALYWPMLQTLTEALGGLAIGAVIGLVLAMLMVQIRLIERYTMPYVMAFQSLPKIALAPLLIVWFGFGATSTVVLVATSCFFPVLVNAVEGFKSTDPERLDLLRAMGASPSQIFAMVVLPSALPFIVSGLQIGLVISILSAIVGEFVNGRDGLGARILMANNVLDIATVFAVLIVLGAMGAMLDLSVRLLRRRILFWSPSERRVTI
ncbi:MAG TPA: ABC transporter permease [Xanthobacteraceae bacterium]|jgi:NitT/TauT family transport system permease protein|nr:ABC transporter permease [Xanthobacteraceae bacterium]